MTYVDISGISFDEEVPRYSHAAVDDTGTVRVYDPKVGSFTAQHNLSEDTQRRIRELARA
jgi:hypothetical protein